MGQSTVFWIVTGLSNNPSIVTDCDLIPIVGGQGIFTSQGSLSTNYGNIPSHNNLYFSLDLYLFPLFDISDYVRFVFDSQIITLNAGDLNSFNGGACSGVASYLVNVVGQVAHNTASVNVEIDLKVTNAATAGYGFRNLLLLFKQEDNDIQTGSLCITSDASPNSASNCPCTKGEYYDGAGCSSCNTFCIACYGPSASQCYQCATGTVLKLKECVVERDSSCATCSGPGFTSCATCPTNWILGTNGLCTDSPTTVLTCQALVVNYYNTVDLGHQYILQLSPDSCDPGILFIRQNIIFSEEAVGSMPAYTWTISKTQHQSYLLTLILADTLLQPAKLLVTLQDLTAKIVVPRKYIPSSFLQSLSDAAPSIKTALVSIVGGSLGGTIAVGATSALWSLISLQQTVGCFIYINVEYPYQTELLLRTLMQASVWEYLPNPVASITNKLAQGFLDPQSALGSKYRPPEKFERYEVVSYFVQNGATILLINLMLLLLLGSLSGLRLIPKLTSNRLLVKLTVALRWNMIARTFLENANPLFLAIFLQIRVVAFHGWYLIICNTFAAVAFLHCSVLLIGLVQVLAINDNNALKEETKKAMYDTLYEGIKLERSGKYYYIMILLRDVMLGLLTVFLQTVPIVQVLLIIVYNIFFVYFIFRYTVFESRILHWIIRIRESLVLMSTCLIMCLFAESSRLVYYEAVGWLIVGAIGISIIIELCYVIGMQIYEIKQIYKMMVVGIKKVYSLLKPKNTANDDIAKRRMRIEARAQRLRRIEIT